MKIGINVNCLNSASQFRGIGFYTRRLIAELEKIPSVQLIKFDQKLSEPVDLIHYPGFNPFHFSLPLINHYPYVVTVHDLTPLKFPDRFPPGIKGKVRWLLQKKQLQSARALITDSEASKKDIVKFVDISAGKVHVVYLAADKIFKTKKSANKFSLPDKFVLYVGDVNYNKNLPLLAQTCLSLNFPLVVVGKQAIDKNFNRNHPENQDLIKFQALAAANPQKIITLGYVKTEDLVAIYNLATVFAQPSLAEGFGLPVLEAFACGCPVITSSNTSLAEISGQAALLINPRDQSQLAYALKSLWLNPNLRTKYTHLGQAQIKQFSWEVTAQNTIKIYDQVLAKK